MQRVLDSAVLGHTYDERVGGGIRTHFGWAGPGTADSPGLLGVLLR